MGHNTPSQSPSPLPRFVWPRPGSDQPRLAWPEFLRVVALQLQRDYSCPGPSTDPGASLGNFLASHVIALADQASALQAWDPGSHVAHAQVMEEEVEAAWYQFMGDQYEPSLSDDETAGLGGHPDATDFDHQEDDGPIRGWLSRDSEDETFLN